MTEKRTGHLHWMGSPGVRWLAAAIAIVGLLASTAAALAVRRDKRTLVETEFRHRAWERSLAIERELTSVVEHVESLAALYRTFGEVHPTHFSAFTDSLLTDHPSIKVFGFDAVVSHAERDAHEKAMREQGLPGYRITERDPEGRLVPAAVRDRYVVVGFVEPLTGNEEAIGYDIASEPTRRAAVEKAAATGQPTLTGPVRLVQETGDQFGALICVPVYRASSTTGDEARWAGLRGVAVGAIRYGDIVSAGLRGLRPAGIDVELFDETEVNAPTLVRAHPAGGTSDPASSAPTGLEVFSHPFEIGGRRFTVRGTPTALWGARVDRLPIAIFLGGLLATAILAGYVLWQSAIKRRLLRVITQLERSEERQAGFGRMLDESHDELYVFDATTLRFVHANRGALENLGYSMEELHEMTPLDLKPRLDAPAFAAWVRPLREGISKKQVLSTVHRRKDGSEYDVEVHLQLSTFDGRPTFIAMILDVTDRKRIEERMSQSQRVEALGILAGGIAHDFNNVLTAIMGYTELSHDLVPRDSILAANLKEILRASERARDVVRRILTFSRRRTMERVTFDLSELVSETLDLMRASLPASVEIRQRLDPGCTVDGEAAQIHQVLMNLCTNAGHAMRDGGGVLEVVLDRIDVDAAKAMRHSNPDIGRYTRIVVRDTGHGISSEVLERVFEPFFTTKRQGDGTGMGLAVVHGIVTAHGGVIHVESRPGRGTTFEVLLPAPKGVESRADKPEMIVPDRGSETILIVDDEQAIVEMMHVSLSRAGYVVESFVDPKLALDRFRQQPDRFDLVITDYTMPKLSGTDLAREVRELVPGLPLILVSGYGELLDEATLRESGVSAMLAKPRRMKEVQALVRTLLDGENAAAGQPARRG